jgi:REP element-mobilizing transposase RayT
VVAKGNAGQAIVRDDHDRGRLITRLSRAVELHRWSCLAYCLLDNHIHLVIETPEPNLGVGMKWLKGAYAQDFNHRHGRTGHLFGGRFYSEIIRRDAHLVSAIVYVSLNPVRAGIVDEAQHWSWSSYAATIGLVPAPPFLDVGRTLELVDDRPDVARRLLALAVAETATRDRRAVHMGSDPWGLTPGLQGPWGQTPRV